VKISYGHGGFGLSFQIAIGYWLVGQLASLSDLKSARQASTLLLQQ